MMDTHLIAKEFETLLEGYYTADEIAETLDDVMCDWAMYRLSQVEEDCNHTDARRMNIIKTLRDTFKIIAKTK